MRLSLTALQIRLRDLWQQLDSEARSFTLLHLAGGIIGFVAALFWLVLGSPHGAFAWTALTGLIMPLLLAGLALRGWPMSVLQPASMLGATGLIGCLSALTGGITSPFLPWLVLIPAEAALSRRRVTLIAALLACAFAVPALWLCGSIGALPLAALPLPLYESLMAASLFGCLVYAGALAVSVRGVHSRATHKAQESEATYRFIADNAADLILRLSVSGKVLYASPASLTLLRRAPGDLAGRAISDIALPDDAEAIQRALVRASYFAEEVALECRMLNASRAPIWVELRCSPVMRDAPERGSRKGKRPQQNAPAMDVIAIARDITQRRQHEDALKRTSELAEAHSRAKSQFLANMSHELRTPLNSILGFSEMISGEMLGPLPNARYREYAELIGESGQHLLNLINDILDVSKIEAGKYVLSRESLNVAHTLERVLDLMMPQYREKNVRLHVDVARALPTIEADARAVRQILFNLLSNALKFTPAGGEASVSLYLDGEALVFEVSDKGIGISEADLKRLARPFEQAASSLAVNPMGTGLGLSLVKSLAALHGGSLSIRSALGRGTSVTVRLPAPAEAQAPRAVPAAA